MAGSAAGARHTAAQLRRVSRCSAATVGNGITIGLEATDRNAVDAAYKAAIAAGATNEGAPGLRAHYHPNYYGAYLRDLDGNKICVVCHRKP